MLQSIPDNFHRCQATRRRVCKVMLKSWKHRRAQTAVPSIPSLFQIRPHISIVAKIPSIHSRLLRIWSLQKAIQNPSACLSAQFRHQPALKALPIRLCSWTMSKSTFKTLLILLTHLLHQFALPKNPITSRARTPFKMTLPSTAERT
jgi:hypothetical protein